MSNILPSVELDDYEIRDALNKNGGVTDNVFGSKYRTTSNICKWSKKKPTKYRGLIFETGNEDPKQWQADNGLCGFTQESIIYSSVEELVEAFSQGNTFVYELPRGGDYPMRAGDYRGYNPNAKSPIWSFEYSGEIDINAAIPTSVTFQIMGNNDIDMESNLVMQDIMPQGISLAEYKFGVIIANKEGIILRKFSDAKLGNDKFWKGNVSVTSLELGKPDDYMAYPILTNPKERIFIPCPINAVQFKAIATDLSSKLGWLKEYGDAYYIQAGGKKDFYGTLAYFNGGDSTINFEGKEPTISVKVNHSDGTSETLLVQTIKLSADRTDGNVNYMDVTLSAASDTIEGDVFVMEVAYNTGSYNYGDVVVCIDKTPAEPLNVNE